MMKKVLRGMAITVTLLLMITAGVAARMLYVKNEVTHETEKQTLIKVMELENEAQKWASSLFFAE